MIFWGKIGEKFKMYIPLPLFYFYGLMEILFYPYKLASKKDFERVCVRIKKQKCFDLKISLPYEIPSGHLKNGQLKKKSIYIDTILKIERELKRIELFIIEKFSNAIELDTKTAKQQINAFITGVEDNKTQILYLYEQSVKDRKLQPTTAKSAMVLYNEMKRYQEENNKVITIDNFTNSFVKKFLLLLHNSERSENCLWNYYKYMRAFCLWLQKQKYVENNLFEGVTMPKQKYGTPYYLTSEERKILQNAELSKRLSIQRDIFIFQCLTGCRVGDLMSLTKDNINGDFLEYIPNKTKRERQEVIKVPLTQTAKDIIYKYKDFDDVKLLPTISEQKYNVTLKEIARKCNLDRKIQVLNPRTHQQETRFLYDVISSHCARRTFIGTLYKKTKDVNIIASMSGHKDNSTAFLRYRNIDEQDKKELVNLLE